MSTRYRFTMGVAAAALAFAVAAPAFAAESATPPSHSGHHARMHKSDASSAATSGDAAVDQLNAQSLAAAQSGKDFMTTPPAPAATAPAKGHKAKM